MQKVVRILFTVALAAAVVSCTWAEILIPGTYKMEWMTSGKASFSPGVTVSIIKAGDANYFTGIKSSKCLYGNTGAYRILIDESKGTGTGYDIAYLIPASVGQEKVDLAAMTPVSLTKSASRSYKGLSEVDVFLGEEGSQIVRKASLDFQLTLISREESENMEGICHPAINGGWSGSVKTDTGQINIRLMDGNENNIYGDKISHKGDSPGDFIEIDKPTQGTSVADYFSTVLYLGKAVLYDGKLYSIEMSKTGETIEVQPYTGDVGRLRINPIDGSGRKADLKDIIIYAEPGLFCYRNGTEFVVPAGLYRVGGTITSKLNNKTFGVSINGEHDVIITKDKTTTMTLGGVVRGVIGDPAKEMTIKRGSNLDIPIMFRIGPDRVGSVLSEESVSVIIKDPKGKVVNRGKAEFG